MSRTALSAAPAAALPIAHGLLRILMVLYWVWGVFLAGLLVATLNGRLVMRTEELIPSTEADQIIMGLRAILVLMVFVAMPANYVFLTRLLAIVETVRAGDPFVAVNASRLQAIAWAMVVWELSGLVNGAIVRAISTPGHLARAGELADLLVKMDAGYSMSGWLAVLLTFLLARVFAEGARMREDLVGTV